MDILRKDIFKFILNLKTTYQKKIMCIHVKLIKLRLQQKTKAAFFH